METDLLFGRNEKERNERRLRSEVIKYYLLVLGYWLGNEFSYDYS